MRVSLGWTIGLALAVGGAMAAIGAADATAQKRIELPFKAAAGDRFSVKVTTVDKKSSGDDVTEHSSRTAAYDGYFIEAGPTGYVVSWTLTARDWKILADKSGAAAIKARHADDMVKAFLNLPIVFEADASGSPTRVPDWQALSQKLADVMRVGLTKAIQERSAAALAAKPKEEADALIKAQIDTMLQAMLLRHDERSAVILFEEAALVGGVQHRALPLAVPIEDTSSAPTLFSDAGIPRTSKITLKRHDKAAGEAEIVWSNTFDQGAFKALLLTVMEGQLKAAQLPADKVDEARKLFGGMNATRVDDGRALISIKEGWARRVELTKHIVVEMPGQPQGGEFRTMVIEVAKTRK